MSVKRWAALLLVAAGCACSRGGGCAGPTRHPEAAQHSPAGTTTTSAAASSGTGSGVSAAPPPDQRRTELEGTVVRVRDGDSIVVLRGGVGIEVRLDGIDCPELVQAYGRKAKSFTSGRVFGQGVRLVVKGKDRYERELAEVFFSDGRSLNRELVSAGLAWWYRNYSTDRTLEALEKKARISRRGLWVDSNPVPPWEFRERNQRPPPSPSRPTPGPEHPRTAPQSP